MKRVLEDIFEKAIDLSEVSYSQEQVKNKRLGVMAASEIEIKQAEARLKIELPEDYKELIRITNGFSAPVNVEPGFEPIEKIDYLKNIDAFLIEVWSQDELLDIGKQLEKSILIGGIDQEQYFLLIPPDSNYEIWKYWKFASWQLGEVEYTSLTVYLNELSVFLSECIEEEKKSQ